MKNKQIRLPDGYKSQIEKDRLLKSPCFDKIADNKLACLKRPKKPIKADTNLIINMATRETKVSGMKVENMS